MFKVERARFDDLEETYNDINMKKLLWKSLSEWVTRREEWDHAVFETLQAEEISNQVNYYSKIALQVQRGLPTNFVVPRLKELVEQFKSFMPVVLDLRNPALKLRHWEQIQDIINQVIF